MAIRRYKLICLIVFSVFFTTSCSKDQFIQFVLAGGGAALGIFAAQQMGLGTMGTVLAGAAGAGVGAYIGSEVKKPNGAFSI